MSKSSVELEHLRAALAEVIARQRRLEERLDALEGKAPPPSAPVPQPLPSSFKRSDPEPEAADDAASRAVPAHGYETKVGLQWVNRIGVVTLVLGIAFFFKWAADNQWIGPGTRVVLGCIAGIGTLLAGDWIWRKEQRVFASGVTATGVALVYIALYAAFEFYNLLPQILAFPLMVAVTATAVILALRYRSEAIAALGFFGAYLTPILLSHGAAHTAFLFSYLLLLDGSALALVRVHPWRTLEVLSLVATGAIYWAWLGHAAPVPPTVWAAGTPLVFFALYASATGPRIVRIAIVAAAVAVAAVVRDRVGLFFPAELLIPAGSLAYARWRRDAVAPVVAFAAFWLLSRFGSWPAAGHVTADFAGISAGFLLFLAYGALSFDTEPKRSALTLTPFAVNSVAYFGSAYALLHETHHWTLGPLAGAVGVAYGAIGLRQLYRSRRTSADDDAAALSIGVALAFVALAIPIQFAGFSIAISWALQAGVLSFIGFRLKSRRALGFAAVLLVLVGIRLTAFNARAHEEILFANLRLFTFVAAGAAALLAAHWSCNLWRAVALAEYAGGHAAILAGLSLEIGAWASRDAAPANLLSIETLSLSVLFAMYAAALVAAGVYRQSFVNRVAGLLLTGFVIAKLYLFDIWQLNRVYRIAAFVILGLLLLGTSFLYSRFRSVLDSLWKGANSNPESPLS